MSRLVRAAASAAVLLTPVFACAHHGEDEGGGLGGMILWIGAGLALGVIALLQWVATRRRGRDAGDSEPPPC